MRNGFQVNVKVTRSPRPGKVSEEPEGGSKDHRNNEQEERLSMERRIEEVQSRMVQPVLSSKRAASQLKVMNSSMEDTLPPITFQVRHKSPTRNHVSLTLGTRSNSLQEKLHTFTINAPPKEVFDTIQDYTASLGLEPLVSSTKHYYLLLEKRKRSMEFQKYVQDARFHQRFMDVSR
jgi:hypothetical protein